MRWVEAAAQRPHHCAAIPFSGMHAKGGFIDTGVDLPGWDPHVYVSVTFIEEAARYLGFPSRQDAESLQGQLDASVARVRELEAELAEKTAQLQAVEVLKNGGFAQAKRPGRPKQKAGV